MSINPATELFHKATRALRRVLLDRSYARYYTSDAWESEYREGYDLGMPAEDGRYGALMALLARNQGKGPILDVGCGEGILEARYRPMSEVPIVAIDYSQTAIRQATERRLPDCHFLCRDFRTFQWDQAFSAIVFNESLYYADDCLDLLHSFTRQLAPDGVFIVSMFRTVVTRRIWRGITKAYATAQHVFIRDGSTGLRWDIRVLRPR